MKTDQSVDNTEVTPSKKLKQARLPFKVISDVSPKATPQPRKRKLSTDDSDSTPKIGRLSKENDTDGAVLISDDSTDVPSKDENSDKLLNPYVKMVAVARKKKQKGKKSALNKKTTKDSKEDLSVSSKDSANEQNADAEKMDVDVCEKDSVTENEEDKPGHNKFEPQSSEKKTPVNSPNKTTRSMAKGNFVKNNDISDSEPKIKPDPSSTTKSPIKKSKQIKKPTRSSSRISNANSEVIVLEDSNNSSDIKPTNQIKEKSVSPKKDKNILKESTPVKGDEISAKSSSKVAQTVTPKRSARNKVASDTSTDLNTSSISSKLDETISSTPKTPKLSRNSSVTNSLDDSLKESSGTEKLTPKQVQKKLEFAKKREEREKEKLEREKKRQQEKDERNKQKQEKEEQRKKEREEKEEAKRIEKEQKEDLKRKEREEKDKQKELEKKIREEKEEQKKKEREEKEEQRKKEKEAREDEKRKKQEALELEKQEQELKKKKAAKAFVNFFVPKQKSENSIENQSTDGPTPVSKNNILSTFTIKSDMRLAPLVRGNLTEEKKEKFDGLMQKQGLKKEDLYLKSLKKGALTGSNGKTWPLCDKDDDDDVMIIEDELPLMGTGGEVTTCEPTTREKLRPKLFSFHENHRPPYWGTWRKKSAVVKPRKPFGYEKILDYEVDSDEDWESDQEGESIEGSAAGSDDEQGPDEYELDNQVFVPHGYLSDEEGTMDGDDILSLSPETQKARLKHLEDEFEIELKKPTEKLKPRMYGILWETEDGGKPDHCADALWNYFSKLAMILDDVTPLLQPAPVNEDNEKKVKKKKQAAEGEQQSPKTEKKKKKEKPENKDPKKPKADKKNPSDVKKNQLGINSFLTKINS